jgi:predicted O-methyltransferase YrrM
MEISLFDSVPVLKEKGHWPIPWTSAIGLIPLLRCHGENLIGCEVGCYAGTNVVYFLENLPNLSKLYTIDPYIEYQDGPTNFVSQDHCDKIKTVFLENIAPFNDRVEFINETAVDAVDKIPNNSLDYIFIDGDHSYEAVNRDIRNYYSKVKSGGIFAGHDFSWHKQEVQRAVFEFMQEQGIDINQNLRLTYHDCWFWVKP